MAASAPSTPMATYQAIISRSMKLGRTSSPARRGIGGPFSFHFGRNAHALPLHKKQVDRDQHDHQSRQNGDMESKKSGERGSVTSSPPRRKIIIGLPMMGT